MLEGTRLITGSANRKLAEDIAEYMHIPLTQVDVDRFNDGEVQVEIQEHIRGETCFVLQPTCRPVNDNLVELLVIIDALKRADVARIIAVIPYYGYSRQDRRPNDRRTPISAKLVASMIETAGADMVVTVDIHSEQQQGFFENARMVNLSASPIIVSDIWKKYGDEDIVIVSPDIGGTTRARSIAKKLDKETANQNHIELAIIDKRRPAPGESEVMHIIGDVEGRTCIIVDDMADTAGTLCHGAAALKDKGAKKVIAYATHAVLSGPAHDNINASVLDEVVVTDTIPLIQNSDRWPTKIRVISVSGLLGQAITRLRHYDSVSMMYM